jgi:LPXTG-site transpeptidase (sortase) family protein
MSETRSHTSEGNVLHIAVVSSRTVSRAPRSIWWRIGLVLFLLFVIVGLWDILARTAALLSITSAGAAARNGTLEVVTDAAPPAHTAPAATTTPAAPAVSQDAAGMVPARLRIPSIGVDAAVQPVGINAAGAMQAPSNFRDVGWYKTGARPGSTGSAVFDGHVNNALTQAGVFQYLGRLREGDAIIVSDKQGRDLTFTITMVRAYEPDAAPVADIFSRAGKSRMALITCDGQWDSAAHQFTKRLVVYAELATSH